ncbi:hypothetical protein PILCRDRAFT_822921 [Piloderma croceum F 1598]|uniref:Uncharacterized protein n=1 Tax=Piloderma croceum (strain F 1598) TaxID=765440 RepID=A0A0C3FKK4_PILCF|nr:hypothetical protein PILCRDRAFT_822921 [Piloderma croceum F 1598]
MVSILGPIDEHDLFNQDTYKELFPSQVCFACYVKSRSKTFLLDHNRPAILKRRYP